MNQFRLLVLLEVMAHAVFNIPAQASPIRVCGNELLDALMSVCGERGLYSPPEGYSRRTPATQSGIATRCCISHCDTDLLETYCNKPATPQSQTAAAPPRTTSASDDRRANEIVVDPPDREGDTAPQSLREESAKAPVAAAGGRANETKTPDAEVEEGRSVDEEGESNTSERVVSLAEDEDQEEEIPRDIPTGMPHKTHSKERSKNRTKGEKRRRKSGRRRSSSERRTLSSERKKDDTTRRRRKEQRLLRKQQQSNTSKRRTKLEKKGSEVVTTPVAIQTAEHPFKNGGYNSTSGDLSRINVTDSESPPSSDAKKDGFFTTITAVLRDVIGFQKVDDGNR